MADPGEINRRRNTQNHHKDRARKVGSRDMAPPLRRPPVGDRDKNDMIDQLDQQQ